MNKDNIIRHLEVNGFTYEHTEHTGELFFGKEYSNTYVVIDDNGWTVADSEEETEVKGDNRDTKKLLKAIHNG